MKNRILLVLALIATSVTASAQILISFTFAGTATSDGLGYTDGQDVSFTFVLAQGAPEIDRAYLEGGTGGYVVWRDYGEPSQRLFQSVSGTGITGTWQAPDVSSEGERSSNSYALIDLTPNSERFFMSTTTFDYGVSPVNSGGLQANGFDVGQVQIAGYGGNPVGFTDLPDSGTPFEFLSGYSLGTYDIDFEGAIYDLSDSADVSFSFSSVTVSAVSAVPEPSTYAPILGGLVLLGAGWRRWRMVGAVAATVA